LLDAEAVLAEEAPVPLLLYISLFRSKLEHMNAKKKSSHYCKSGVATTEKTSIGRIL